MADRSTCRSSTHSTPGSIHDVSTLTNVLTELNILSLDASTFVLE